PPPLTALSGFCPTLSSHLPYLHSFPTRRSSDLRNESTDSGTPGCRSRTQACCSGGRSYLCFHTSALHGRSHSFKITAFQDADFRSEEHTSELQSRFDLVCRLLLEKNKYLERRTQ